MMLKNIFKNIISKYYYNLEVILSGGLLNNLFPICAFVGGGIFILKTFLPVDTGSEITGDFTSVTDTDSSFSLFTIESISAFFMCFGIMGWVSHSYIHYSLKLSSIIAVISGIIGMLFFAFLISRIKKLEYDPKGNINDLVNKTGKAYMNFAPKGSGKITIEFNGRIEEFDARNNTDSEIKSFEPVKVVKIENNEIFVEKDN